MKLNSISVGGVLALLALELHQCILVTGKRTFESLDKIAVSVAAVLALAFGATAQAQQVVAWGWGAAATVPAEINNQVTKIAAGGRNTMALLSNGTLKRWGDTYIPLPDGNDFVEVAVGDEFLLAMRKNGGVVCSANFYWAWVCSGSPSGSAATVPPGTRGSAGFFSASLLGPDGAVLDCWGQDGSGECHIPVQSWVQIDHGYQHGIGLRSDGTVSCWGANNYGQCNVPAKLAAVRVAAGRSISGAVRISGTVAVWGYSQQAPVQPPPDLVDVADLVIGEHHLVALRNDGTVRCWGDNGGGQCNVPAGLNRVVAIAAGQLHTVAMRIPCSGDVSANGITDGVDLAAVLTAWGTNGQGQFDCDLNNDGIVNGVDLSMVLSNWGPCP